MEPYCWIPISLADKVVFSGDHKQLPPTIKSQEAAKKGLQNTLFEKAIAMNSGTLLNTQYRMNEVIMSFSSRMFYDNLLIADASVAHETVFPNDNPIEFIDTAGCAFYESTESETKSLFNKDEANILSKHLDLYLQQIDIEKINSIAVISPYKAQIEILKQSISGILPSNFDKKISVNTIDSFQGQERDIVYISLVRSNDKNEIGFLNDLRRMNVAMTRAKRKLIIIGDSATISSNGFYNSFLDYINEINAYRSAYEFM
ncbi:MAG: hypothetical protein IPO21_01445 [Bacteroidales bacterium]|nr:hypothetical protein [Bacteroidales bacterium]